MSTNIFAHRGASRYAPENTMAAFNLAYQQGADGIETDVHLTKDCVPVLMHDEQLKRTTGSAGYIKDYTFEQLKQFDTGSWFSPEFAGSRIIALEEFLKWIYNKPLYLNIELKNNKIEYNHLEEIVYEQISYFHLLHRTILSTFNPTSVIKLKALNRHIDVAFLTSKRFKNTISAAGQLGANAVHIKYRLLNQLLVDKSHQRHMAVRVFTVNKPKQILRSFAMGCDAIFTDCPELAIQCRNQFNKQ